MPRFTFFETALGACCIVWSERGIVTVRLPERDIERARLNVRNQFGDAVEAKPNPLAQRAITRIIALLEGNNVDFSSIKLDDSACRAFSRRVYDAARQIPIGSTLSYGELASRLGAPGAARAVGQALGRNPWPLIVPCHRVLAANGKLTGFSAPGGIETKRRLLRIEKAAIEMPSRTAR